MEAESQQRGNGNFSEESGAKKSCKSREAEKRRLFFIK